MTTSPTTTTPRIDMGAYNRDAGLDFAYTNYRDETITDRERVLATLDKIDQMRFDTLWRRLVAGDGELDEGRADPDGGYRITITRFLNWVITPGMVVAAAQRHPERIDDAMAIMELAYHAAILYMHDYAESWSMAIPYVAMAS